MGVVDPWVGECGDTAGVAEDLNVGARDLVLDELLEWEVDVWVRGAEPSLSVETPSRQHHAADQAHPRRFQGHEHPDQVVDVVSYGALSNLFSRSSSHIFFRRHCGPS